MWIALGIAGVVLVVLTLGYLMDRKARISGNTTRDAGQIWASMRQTRSEVRSSDQIKQLRQYRQQK